MSLPEGGDPTTLHVQRALDGDPESLSWIVTRFTPLLRAQASYRLGASAKGSLDIEDLVADAWLIALQKMPRFDAGDRRSTPALLSYLAQTVRFVANNALRAHLRGQARRPARGDSGSSLSDVEAQVGDIVSRAAHEEEGLRVAEALAMLDEASRKLVVLRGIEGLSNREIGELLGEKPNTISHRYRRIIDQLRSQLADSVFSEMVDD